MIALAKRPRLTVADLFCGAGGTSTGALEAGDELGYEVDLTAINHNLDAIDTHVRNHPQCRTLLTSLDKVSPRDLYRPGELDMLWASPECTHHSVARGGKPINEQSRATAFCILKWADALRPPIILVENVPEFITWGGCGTNNRPLINQKGKTFMAWVATLESLGYRVDWRVLCAADYGDPTTRRRLIVQAVRGRRKIVWPDPTHQDPDIIAEHAGRDLFGAHRKPWVPARDIIDWTLPSQSIYDRRKLLYDLQRQQLDLQRDREPQDLHRRREGNGPGIAQRTDPCTGTEAGGKARSGLPSGLSDANLVDPPHLLSPHGTAGPPHHRRRPQHHPRNLMSYQIEEITDPARRAELLKRGALDILIAGSGGDGCFHSVHNDRHSILALKQGDEITVWELTGATKEIRKAAAAHVRDGLVARGATLLP